MARKRLTISLLLFMLGMGAIVSRDNLALGLSQMAMMSALLSFRLIEG